MKNKPGDFGFFNEGALKLQKLKQVKGEIIFFYIQILKTEKHSAFRFKFKFNTQILNKKHFIDRNITSIPFVRNIDFYLI